jgi:hypothetical protein
MKRVAILAAFLGSLACSGPEAPAGDAGFGTTTVPGTGGSYATGTGGSFATGPGSGGSTGAGGYPGAGPTWRGDAAVEDNGGAAGAGGGRGKKNPGDAGIAAVCPPGAMTGAPCNVPALTCVASSGDGGAQQVCTCPRKGGWTCR